MSLRSASSSPASDRDPHSRPRRGGRGLRILLWVAAAIVVLTLLIRFVGGPVAKAVINGRLEKMPEYQGGVETVKIAPWRAGVEVNGFVLKDRKRPDDVPLMQVEELDLRVDMRALFRGRLGGQLRVVRPEFAFVQTELPKPEDAEKAKQTMQEIRAKVQPWRKALEETVPLELSRLEVEDGKMRFIDRAHQPNSEIVFEYIQIVATGLSNRQEADPLPAKLDLQGTLTGNGKVKIRVEADPLAESPTFTTTMELQQMELTAWNEFLRGFAGVDVSQGTFEFFVEAKAENGRYEGYVKPFFRDLDFKGARDENDGLGTRIKEAAIDVVTEVFENDAKEQVATKAPFSGSFAGDKVDVWTAVENLLRNAFVQALRDGFDRGF